MKDKKVMLLICIAFSIFWSEAYAFQVVETSQQPSQDVSGERNVRGDFISLSGNRLLKTSVGDYSLSSMSIVDDLRKNKNTASEAKVVVTLQGSTVKRVVIY